MTEEKPQHDHYLGEHKTDGDISRLAEMLAPAEEVGPTSGTKNPRTTTDRGGVPGTGAVSVPKAFDEGEEEKGRVLGLEPVILVIVLLMTAFIAFIAYLIT